jgi:hypothetical protein
VRDTLPLGEHIPARLRRAREDRFGAQVVLIPVSIGHAIPSGLDKRQKLMEYQY